MNEVINNRKSKQQQLKKLIRKLHEGAAVEEVQEEFNQLTIGVTANEIVEMEQALVDEGMPVEDIQRLCDVHAAVFKGSIEDIHKQDAKMLLDFNEGHPLQIFKSENRAIEILLDKEILIYLNSYIEDSSRVNKKLLLEALNKLVSIDKHYSRKENLIFPYMEKYNITAPPQVMWGVDDEIRNRIKSVIDTTDNETKDLLFIKDAVKDLVIQVHEMIFKEEKIMFPMISDLFTQKEWTEIKKSSDEIGYTLINEAESWSPDTAEKKEDSKSQVQNQKITTAEEKNNIEVVTKDSQTKIMFDAGALSSEEVNSILNTLPFDMTFVGADNRVKYFTQGKERIFARPITIIGRHVKNCHPPKSVHIVEQIVEDLRTGKKESEDFWIKMGDKFVYIRYFAVRNKQGEFLGTLEISQDIKSITELEGEKRLMS